MTHLQTTLQSIKSLATSRIKLAQVQSKQPFIVIENDWRSVLSLLELLERDYKSFIEKQEDDIPF